MRRLRWVAICLALSASSYAQPWLVAAYSDRVERLDPESGHLVGVLFRAPEHSEIFQASISPDHRTLYLLASGSFLSVDLATGVRKTLALKVYDFSLAPDGARVFLSDVKGGSVLELKTSRRRVVLSAALGNGRDVTWSRDSQHLWAGATSVLLDETIGFPDLDESTNSFETSDGAFIGALQNNAPDICGQTDVVLTTRGKSRILWTALLDQQIVLLGVAGQNLANQLWRSCRCSVDDFSRKLVSDDCGYYRAGKPQRPLLKSPTLKTLELR